MLHALKIEDLDLSEDAANKIVDILKEFICNIGWNELPDRQIESLECRARDGFWPHGHNKGGLEAVCFADQYSLRHPTGFKNADKTIERYNQFDIEYFIASHEEYRHLKEDQSNWTEENCEVFDEYCREDTEASCMFSAQCVLNSENKVSILLDVCVKDAPYHREFDDRLEYSIEFKNITDLEKQLAYLLKNTDVQTFKTNVESEYTF